MDFLEDIIWRFIADIENKTYYYGSPDLKEEVLKIVSTDKAKKAILNFHRRTAKRFYMKAKALKNSKKDVFINVSIYIYNKIIDGYIGLLYTTERQKNIDIDTRFFTFQKAFNAFLKKQLKQKNIYFNLIENANSEFIEEFYQLVKSDRKNKDFTCYITMHFYKELMYFKKSNINIKHYDREVKTLEDMYKELKPFLNNKSTLDIPPHPNNTLKQYATHLQSALNNEYIFKPTIKDKDHIIEFLNLISTYTIGKVIIKIPKNVNSTTSEDTKFNLKFLF